MLAKPNLSNEIPRLIIFIKHVLDLKQIKVFPVDIKIRHYVPNSVGLIWTRWCVSKDVNDHKHDGVHGHSVTWWFLRDNLAESPPDRNLLITDYYYVFAMAGYIVLVHEKFTLVGSAG